MIDKTFWASMTITLACEIAACTILAAIGTNDIEADSEVWSAVWFFAVAGGIAWILGRTGEAKPKASRWTASS